MGFIALPHVWVRNHTEINDLATEYFERFGFGCEVSYRILREVRV